MNNPRWFETPGLRWLLWTLSGAYRVWMRARAAAYRNGWLKTHRLPAKVISVGNLTVGGAGKTPLVLRLASWLRKNNARVAILTRGYGRRDRLPLVMNGLGDVPQYTPELMGDEPILFARHVPEATIGIGGDRLLLARQVLALAGGHPPDAFLLDDGFQHLRVARDLDIVVVDASDPFGNGLVLPAGPLREPRRALERADVFVINRAPDEMPKELLAELRRYNSRAPVFRAWTELENVHEVQTERSANLYALRQQPVLAFCGIGNPQAFWDDLARWGFQVAGCRAFPDHTRYTEADMNALDQAATQAGAKVLLTTEKDRINLEAVPPPKTPAFFCRIQLALEDEEGFFAVVRDCLQAEAG